MFEIVDDHDDHDQDDDDHGRRTMSMLKLTYEPLAKVS